MPETPDLLDRARVLLAAATAACECRPLDFSRDGFNGHSHDCDIVPFDEARAAAPTLIAELVERCERAEAKGLSDKNHLIEQYVYWQKRAEAAEREVALLRSQLNDVKVPYEHAQALSERAEAAEREADRLRHGVPVEGDFVCPDACALDRARAALRRYGRHLDDCEYRSARDFTKIGTPVMYTIPCTCGLTAALEDTR